jgi:pimeloyl-ACP methyl ester carboxylesterase
LRRRPPSATYISGTNFLAGTTAYVQDLQIFIEEELGGAPVVLLGHSLGGVNAYQLAARKPALVRAMMIEDIGAEINDDQSWLKKLPSRVPTLRELQQTLESLLRPGAFSYFGESAVEFRTDGRSDSTLRAWSVHRRCSTVPGGLTGRHRRVPFYSCKGKTVPS